MKKTSVPKMLQLLLLLLIDVIIIATSAQWDSIQVVSFRKPRKVRNGPAKCALETANKTSSSSLQQCSLDCVRDAICAAFNIKHSHTCDLYNFRPKVVALVANCENYQVILALTITSVIIALMTAISVLIFCLYIYYYMLTYLLD